MKQCAIIPKWIGVGHNTNHYRPEVAYDYTLISWRDVTGQPAGNLKPDPNLYVIEAFCSDAVYQEINADDKFEVLWEEDVV